MSSAARTRGHRSRAGLLGFLLGVSLLAGCVETRVEVQIEADGSGTRRVEMAWQEDTLQELNLDTEEVKALLELAPERGWTMRREDRSTGGGPSEPHLVFRRETQLSSIGDWPEKASDLGMRVSLTEAAHLDDQIELEIGRGAGYRTVTYRETLDGREIRSLLDQYAATNLVERIAKLRPETSEMERAELRGLILGHLGHLELWVLDDDDIDLAQAEFVRDVSPPIARLFQRRRPTTAEIELVAQMLREILEHDEGMNEQLETELPGLSLLAFTNLKLEISLPGMIVESNADRVGEGHVAWEGPIWDAVNSPMQFLVRSRVQD